MSVGTSNDEAVAITTEILDVLIIGSGIGARCAAMAINQAISQAGNQAGNHPGSEAKLVGGNSLSVAAIALPSATAAMPTLLVSPPCQQFLQNIDVWSAVSAQASWIDTLHVSEQGRLGATRFTGADMGSLNLGSAVRADALHSALSDIANTVAGTGLVGLSVDDEAGLVHVQLSDSANNQKTVTARVVLVADEGAAAVEALQNRKSDKAGVAFSLAGSVANNHENVAYQRYVGDSKITVLPAAAPRDVTVVVEGAAASELVDTASELVLPKVQAWFGHRLGRFESLLMEATTTLATTVPAVPQSRVIELGAPAMAAPFAPGNLHGCCYAIAALLPLLQEGGNDATVGRQLAIQLENYQPVTAGLDRLFAAELGPLNHLRGAGLMALELVTPLRQRLLKRQLGQQSLLPPLMRSGDHSSSRRQEAGL